MKKQKKFYDKFYIHQYKPKILQSIKLDQFQF